MESIFERYMKCSEGVDPASDTNQSSDVSYGLPMLKTIGSNNKFPYIINSHDIVQS